MVSSQKRRAKTKPKLTNY